MKESRAAAAAVELNGKIYVTGGENVQDALDSSEMFVICILFFLKIKLIQKISLIESDWKELNLACYLTTFYLTFIMSQAQRSELIKNNYLLAHFCKVATVSVLFMGKYYLPLQILFAT